MMEYLGGICLKLHEVFIDSKKTYNKVDGKALWNDLKIYCVGEQLLEGSKAFIRRQEHMCR